MGSTHEHHRSLWIATTPAGGGQVEHLTPARAQIAIIGAGITGMTLARLLADTGADVVVIDAGRIASGATGYTTAKVTALHRAIYRELTARHGVDRTAIYANANQAAVELIASLVDRDEIDCDFTRAPAITYALDERNADELEKELTATTDAGLPVRIDTATELPFDVTGAIRLDDQAHFHPRKYVLGLADAVSKVGGRVIEHTRVLSVDEEDNGCVVVTETGTMRADIVVLATHLPLGVTGAFFARAQAYRSYALAASVDVKPKGMYISIDDPTRSLRPAGEHLIVGGEGHKVGQDPDTEHCYTALESWAREHFDVHSIPFRWSAQDYETVDGMPYIGRLGPTNQRIHVATGFRKWGMSNGTAAAMILCDAILDRDNPWAEAFDSTRWQPLKSARRLVASNLDVVKRFVGDRIASLHPPSIDTLEPGQGALVDLDGDTVAAYCDPEGVVHAVSATCTHMGCRVAFNTAERTWDCPCHGSRFGVDGRVLEGPAVEDLAARELSES